MAFVKRTGDVFGSGPEFDGAEAQIVREQCGLTQAQMAHEMGVSERTVWTWENAGRAYHFQSKPQRLMLEQLMERGRDKPR